MKSKRLLRILSRENKYARNMGYKIEPEIGAMTAMMLHLNVRAGGISRFTIEHLRSS
jgi:hypothetical protein